mmetsp:Transcript_47281/g.110579  ORF Transcript_47281/g.110579 Transcript_47281/m.110579 type:complete len:359 (-) Transcript_47281:53-1129(-)
MLWRRDDEETKALTREDKPDADCFPLYILDTRVNVDKLLEINQLQETFKAQFFLEATVKIESNDPQEVGSFLDKVCARTTLENSTAPSIEDTKPTVVKEPNAVKLRWVIAGEFSESLELENFPFDNQELSVTIRVGMPCRAGKPQIRFRDSGQSRVVLNVFNLVNTWMPPDKVVVKTGFTDPSKNFQGHVFPTAKISVNLQRIPWFYVSNIVVPMATIVLMSACSLSIDPNDVAGRLSASLTLVLTAVAYKYIVAQMVPNIGYNTWLDWYVLMCWAFLVFIVLENCVALYYLGRDHERTLAVSVFVGFGLSNALFFLWAGYVYYVNPEFGHARSCSSGIHLLNCDTSDEEEGLLLDGR